jgi:hypothetical protein
MRVPSKFSRRAGLDRGQFHSASGFQEEDFQSKPHEETGDVSAFCRDLDNWPRSWMGLEKDLPPDEALVVCMRPLIEHLALANLLEDLRQHATTFGR